jgi:hypothetical protein
MMHLASQLASKQRRVQELFKRARTERMRSTAHAAAATVQHAPPPPPHRGEEGMAAFDTALSTLSSDLTLSQHKEIVGVGRHFSKIASRFAFDNDATSYSAWVIQFKAETENYDLDNTLVDPRNDTPLAALRQKTVYHMILSCVPKAVLVSITSNLREHTAYEAWRTLRRHYIGDEATYLQGLETRFSRATWRDADDFPTFEIGFNQLVAELETAGQVKPDHVKKSVFMHAIESSNKKDVRGLHVFDRLNTTSKIHYQASFTEWMVHMRVEAQYIHDSILAHRGSKRAREHPTSDAPLTDALPISFVAPPAASQGAPTNRPPPIHAQRRGNTGTAPMCRDFQQHGSCRFGARCRFSHTGRPGNTAPASASLPKSSEACNLFRQGRCFYGDKCRYAHTDAVKEETPAAQHLLRHISHAGAITFDNQEQ